MANAAQPADDHADLLRTAARGGVVGPGLFVAIVVVGGWLTDGYSHAGQKISELGGQGAPYAWLQNVNFILLGALVLGLAWALGRHLGAPYRGPVLLGIFGVSSLIANGLLPCDVACVGRTPSGLAHNVTGVLGFVAAIVGMSVLARRWRTDPRWHHHVIPTVGAVVVALGGLVWFIATQAADPLHPLGGVAQRIFVGTLLLWLARTAWLLDRQLSPARPTPSTAPATSS